MVPAINFYSSSLRRTLALFDTVPGIASIGTSYLFPCYHPLKVIEKGEITLSKQGKTLLLFFPSSISFVADCFIWGDVYKRLSFPGAS